MPKISTQWGRVDAQLIERVTRAAESAGVSKTAYITAAVMAALQRDERKVKR